MFVYALFWDEADAAKAVEGLVEAEFSPDEICVLMRERAHARRVPLRVKTGIARGALVGAALGAVGGGLALPAAGWLAAGGLAAVLQGAYLVGAAGTLAGALGGLGHWHHEISHPHEAELGEGAVLVGVPTSKRIDVARDVLLRAGAIQTHTSSKRHARTVVEVRGRMGDDHRSMEPMLAELVQVVDGRDSALITRALRDVEKRVDDHIAMEEGHLFERLEKAHPLEVRRLRAEHRKFRRTLEDLIVDAELHASSKERVERFVTELLDHVRREDETLHAWAEALRGSPRRPQPGPPTSS